MLVKVEEKMGGGEIIVYILLSKNGVHHNILRERERERERGGGRAILYNHVNRNSMIVTLLFIPEVGGEAGIGTVRRFFYSFSTVSLWSLVVRSKDDEDQLQRTIKNREHGGPTILTEK